MASANMTARLLAFAQVLVEEDIAMSVEELLCFLTVAAHPGLSVGELAQQTGLPQSTVSRHLKRLCARPRRSKGQFGPLQWELDVGENPMLEQRVHPTNGKQRALHVTRHGEALLDRFESAMNGAP